MPQLSLQSPRQCRVLQMQWVRLCHYCWAWCRMPIDWTVSSSLYNPSVLPMSLSSISVLCLPLSVAGIGAIGIARCFTYGGFKKRPLYDAAQPVSSSDSDITHEEYKKSASKNEPSINHFYTKLLKLKDLMKTAAGKKRAEQRHQIMLDFLRTFQLETEGKA
jgi:hypothetical protein